jgi:acyl-CoA synthetase (AMP-forming)/AMP-acid ligase II
MVQECAVFGLGDDKFGEAVCCAIVPKHADARFQYRNENDLTIDNMLPVTNDHDGCSFLTRNFHATPQENSSSMC